jgi:hypothetical protein
MTRGLVTAGLLVLLANGWLLVGVARNRSTVVERVELTEAEMPIGYSTVTSATEGPTLLHINWIAGVDPSEASFSEAQLRAAHFDLPPAGPSTYADRKPWPRDVVVALEMAGPARQQFVANFYAHTPGNAVPPPSQLVLVDLGPDLASVRAAHPDPTHTLVLHAVVQAQQTEAPNGDWTWRGEVTALEPTDVHVPYGMAAALTDRRPGNNNQPRYVVTLCVGARGEPWIESVRAR